MKIGDLVKISNYHGHDCMGIVMMVDEYAEECEVMYISKDDGTSRYTWIELEYAKHTKVTNESR